MTALVLFQQRHQPEAWVTKESDLYEMVLKSLDLVSLCVLTGVDCRERCIDYSITLI